MRVWRNWLDVPDLGSGAEKHGGSNPSTRTMSLWNPGRAIEQVSYFP